jgi:hypothetical protein
LLIAAGVTFVLFLLKKIKFIINKPMRPDRLVLICREPGIPSEFMGGKGPEIPLELNNKA